MNKIRISTDSTADIPKELCQALSIPVLPLTILDGDKEYRDGVDISTEEFYKILDTAVKLPVSSQVASPLYTALFEETWQAGYTDLVHVAINAKGSGTYQAGCLSRELFFEEHPEAIGQLTIHLIDSRTYSMGYGLAVVEAAQMVQAGRTLEEILAHIQDWVDHARPMFVPLTLKCVKKSGRVSAAAAFVGDAIGLKPLITFEDGESRILAKARGEQKAIEALVATCMKERRPGTNYALVHGNNPEAYGKLKEALMKEIDMPPLVEYPVGCIISINTGPNMIAIIYRT